MQKCLSERPLLPSRGSIAILTSARLLALILPLLIAHITIPVRQTLWHEVLLVVRDAGLILLVGPAAESIGSLPVVEAAAEIAVFFPDTHFGGCEWVVLGFGEF